LKQVYEKLGESYKTEFDRISKLLPVWSPSPQTASPDRPTADAPATPVSSSPNAAQD
jgi:hypothetical protein